MRLLNLILAASVMLSTPANAIFFFVIPIPKGKVNPDAVNANLEQRRHSMCAAYHLNVVDPDLSGKKEDSWRGEVFKNAAERMTGFPEFKKLTGIYVRQWQLQMKSSYQAGMSYSQMLADACNKVAFPYDKSQYDTWGIIKTYAPNATNLEALQIPAKPIDFNSWFSGAQFPKGIRPTSLTKAVANVRVAPSGEVTFCEIDQSSSNDQLDALACDMIRKNGRFSPEIQGFRLVGSEHDISIDWASALPTQSAPVNAPLAPIKAQLGDPTFELAVSRCTRMGYTPGSKDYKVCINQQLNLLSK